MFIDLLNAALFTPSNEDASSDRTLRFDESLDLKTPNWPPFEASNSLFEVNSQGEYTYQTPINICNNFNITSRNNAYSSLSAVAGSYWYIGYHIQNHLLQQVESIGTLLIWDHETQDYDGTDPYYQFLGPLKIFPIPEATCSDGLIEISICSRNNGIVTPDALYNLNADGSYSADNLQIYASPLYESLGIKNMPMLFNGDGEDLFLGLQLDPDTGDPISESYAVPFEVYPIPVGPIQCKFLTFSDTDFPISLQAQADVIHFPTICSASFFPKNAFLPLISSSSIEAKYIDLPAAVITSDITSENTIYYPNVGSYTDNDLTILPYIAQSTLTAPFIGPVVYEGEGTNIVDTTIEGSVMSFVQVHFYNSQLNSNYNSTIYNCKFQDSAISTQVGTTEANLITIQNNTANVGYFNTMVGQYTTDVTSDGTRYIDEIQKSRYIKSYVGNMGNDRYRDFFNLDGKDNYDLEITNSTISNSKIQSQSVYLQDVNINNSEIETEILLEASDVNVSNSKLNIRMFGDTDSVLNIYDDSEVELFSDKEKDAVCNPELDTNGCSHSLDVYNGPRSTLIITSINPVSLNENYGIINVSNSVRVGTNVGLINGYYCNVRVNNNTIATSDSFVGTNNGSLIGQTANVNEQSLVTAGDHRISAFLYIFKSNYGDATLDINAEFIRRSVNYGHCSSATFTHTSRNEGTLDTGSFQDTAINNNSLYKASVSFGFTSISQPEITLTLCDIIVSTRFFFSDIVGCTVNCSIRGSIKNELTSGCDIKLYGSLFTEELNSCTIEIDNGALSATIGAGNTIIVKNEGTVYGKLINYSLPIPPKGACSGPPDPQANPNLCNEDDGCIDCLYDLCWNLSPPFNNGGSIVFRDESQNYADINILNQHSIPDYCVSAPSRSPPGGYMAPGNDLTKIVAVTFEDESINKGLVHKAIFNGSSQTQNPGSSFYSIYNDNSSCGGSSSSDRFNGGSHSFGDGGSNSLGTAIVNNGSIFLNGGLHSISELNGGTVYVRNQATLRIGLIKGGNIFVGQGSRVEFTNDIENLNLTVATPPGNTVTLDFSVVTSIDNFTLNGELAVQQSNLLSGLAAAGLTSIIFGNAIVNNLSIGNLCRVQIKGTGEIRNLNNAGVLIIDIQNQCFIQPLICNNTGLVYQRGLLGWCVTGGLNLCIPTQAQPPNPIHSISACNACTYKLSNTTRICKSVLAPYLIGIFGDDIIPPGGTTLTITNYINPTC